MALFGDNWMRVFDIPETSKHIKGFTIYKIVSLVSYFEVKSKQIQT